ncbi:MAG TPA: response regulator [Candidatus Limnocylindria bacterium]|nr:response regulator [Candidatus Limnocylindria bacterium]
MCEHGPNEPCVLLVDDDPAIRVVVSDLLESEGYHVVAVETREDARAVITRQPVALMLLDTGVDALASPDRLRFAEPHPPIVVFSAGTDLEVVAARAGAVAWLAKPFETQDLIALVARYS